MLKHDSAINRMNRKLHPEHHRRLFVVVSLIIVLIVALAFANVRQTIAQGPQPQTPAAALGTGFNYHGQLKKNNVPVNDNTCGMTFSLWDSSSGGAQVGGSQTIVPVTVTIGLFTVVLNDGNQFGVSAFTGQVRWLQTAVLCAGDGSPVTLSRQRLTATPYALFSAAPWVSSGSNLTYNAGNVGIGTTNPLARLSVRGASDFSISLGNDAQSADNKTWHLSNVGGDLLIRPVNDAENTVQADVLSLQRNGNVGIGTTTPSSLLNVRTTAASYGMLRIINPTTNGEASIGYRDDSDADSASWIVGKNVGAVTDDSFAWYYNGTKMTLLNNGNVGIGTTSPAARLHLANASNSGAGLVVEASEGDRAAMYYNPDTGMVFDSFRPSDSRRLPVLLQPSGGNVGIGTTTPSARLTVRGPDTSFFTSAFQVNDSNGNYGFFVRDNRTVGIGALAGPTTTHACYNTNTFAACSSAAEYVPAIDDGVGYAEAADLVSIAPSIKNPYDDEHSPFVVTKAAKPCDDNLLGFIVNPESGADGKKLNEHYLPLAIYGYFPAKVTLENGAIKRGDPITSSSKPGYGMKATQACKIIGYALADADQEGTIQVFANHGENAAPEVAALRTQVQLQAKQIAAQQKQLDALSTRLTALEQSVKSGSATTSASR
jgi:hypothetical protein